MSKILTAETFKELYMHGERDGEGYLDLTGYKIIGGCTLAYVIAGCGNYIKNVKFPYNLVIKNNPSILTIYHCEFRDVFFDKIDMYCRFVDCVFHGCAFRNSIYEGLKFVRCQFKSAFISTVFKSCTFNKCDISVRRMFDTAFFDCVLNGTEINGDNIQWFTIIGLGDRCPSNGSFIGWKACKSEEYGTVLVKLKIPDEAKRSSSSGKKCRCSKAEVLGLYKINGERLSEDKCAYSFYDNSFIYKTGSIIKPIGDFNEDRFVECGSGIHFFLTREDALSYAPSI